MTTPQYKLGRKEDRAHMAQSIEAAAQVSGTLVKVTADADSRCTRVELQAPGSVQASITLDGRSSSEDFVVHWHMDTDSDNLLAPGFAPSMNTVHYRKATDVARGFPALLTLLQARLATAADGSAYMSPAAASAHRAESNRRYAEMLMRSRGQAVLS